MGSLDDFADVERDKQEAFADIRTRVLGPYVRPLHRLGISADHISLAGVLLLVPYVVLFGSHPGAAFLCLVFSVLLDGLDGVYARITGTVSEGGALTDVCADQVGMVLTVLLTIHHGLALPVLAAYYVVIYVVMISLSVFQNYCGAPMQVILRSKYPLFALMGVWALTGWEAGFNLLYGFFSVTMSWSALQSFFRLRRHLSGDPRSS